MTTRNLGWKLFGCTAALGLVFVGLGGCTKPEAPDAVAQTSKPSTQPEPPVDKKPDAPVDASSSKPTDQTKKPESTPAGKPVDDKKTVEGANSIPKDLTYPGFEWYGLGSTKPVDFVMQIPSKKETYTGSVAPSFKGVEGAVAKYSITRTGRLSELLGTDEVELRKDGIYMTGNSKSTLDKASLDLPANPKPGFKWKVDNKLTSEGRTQGQNMLCEVVGVVPLKLNGKVIQSLLVKTDGTVELDGVKSKLTAKYWYAKGQGPVKTDIWLTQKGKPPVEMIMTRAEDKK